MSFTDPRPTAPGPELAAWEARNGTQYPTKYMGAPPGVNDASARDAIETAVDGSEYTYKGKVYVKEGDGWTTR